MAVPGFVLDPRIRVMFAEVGVHTGDLLRSAGLAGDLLSNGPVLVTPAEYFRLWQALDGLTKDPALAVRLVEAMSGEAFDVPLLAALCSQDLNSAARRLSKYKPLVGPLGIEIEVGPAETAIRIDWSASGEPPLALAWAEVLFWVGLVRLGTRSRVVPTAITSPRPIPCAEVADFAGVTPKAGSYEEIRFSAGDASTPFLTVSDAMIQQLEPGMNTRLGELQPHHTITEHVRAALVELLPAGGTTIDAVAASLAVSSRTLQRRLNAESTSYQAVLAGTREELARNWLRSQTTPVDQIAFLLGYSEPTSFYRAFHSWTGDTPHGIRASA